MRRMTRDGCKAQQTIKQKTKGTRRNAMGESNKERRFDESRMGGRHADEGERMEGVNE